jgi:hypothetical protein
LDKHFSLTKCTKEEKAAFADTLYKLSQRIKARIATSTTPWVGL